MEDIIKSGEYRDITIIAKNINGNTERKFYVKDFDFNDFFTMEDENGDELQDGTIEEIICYYSFSTNGSWYLTDNIWYWLKKEFGNDVKWNEELEIIFGIDETNKGTELFNY